MSGDTGSSLNAEQQNTVSGLATAQPEIETYKPSLINVSASEVSDRISDIINADSPLMQSAVTGANAGMNARGLLNSSMAQGAASKAVIDAASPIAAEPERTARAERAPRSGENLG